jgi:hypothetical protein
MRYYSQLKGFVKQRDDEKILIKAKKDKYLNANNQVTRDLLLIEDQFNLSKTNYMRANSQTPIKQKFPIR